MAYTEKELVLDIKTEINELDSEDLLKLWNNYCVNGCTEEEIHYNDKFTILELWCNNLESFLDDTIDNLDYSLLHDLFYYRNGFDLISFDLEEIKDKIEVSELVDYVLEKIKLDYDIEELEEEDELEKTFEIADYLKEK